MKAGRARAGTRWVLLGLLLASIGVSVRLLSARAGSSIPAAEEDAGTFSESLSPPPPPSLAPTRPPDGPASPDGPIGRVVETETFVAGRILDPKERPLVGARVFLCPAAWPMFVDTALGAAPSGLSCETDAEGRYAFRGDFAGKFTLLATAAACEPLVERLDLTVGEARAVPDLRLSAGLSIHGVVLDAGAPVKAVRVLARWYGVADVPFRPPESLVKCGSHYVATSREARTGPDGHFVLEGLTTGPWRLRVLVDDDGVPVHPDVRSAVDRIVSLPSPADVAFDVARARVQAYFPEATFDGSSREPAIVRFGEGTLLRRFVDSGGKAVVSVLPWTEVRIQGFLAGYAPLDASLRSGGSGSIRWLGRNLARGSAGEARPDLPRTPFGRVIGPDGEPVRARAVLTGAHGETVSTRFVAFDDRAWYEEPGGMPAAPQFAVIPTLRAGDYVLSLSAPGCEDVRAPFTFRPTDGPRDFVLHGR